MTEPAPHLLPQILAALDGVGSFVFALSGGLLAVYKRFDLFGVLLLAFVVAVTGGYPPGHTTTSVLRQPNSDH